MHGWTDGMSDLIMTVLSVNTCVSRQTSFRSLPACRCGCNHDWLQPWLPQSQCHMQQQPLSLIVMKGCGCQKLQVCEEGGEVAAPCAPAPSSSARSWLIHGGFGCLVGRTPMVGSVLATRQAFDELVAEGFFIPRFRSASCIQYSSVPCTKAPYVRCSSAGPHSKHQVLAGSDTAVTSN